MKKLLKTFWLLAASLTAITLSSAQAEAAPITGKIGVGTWDTQAEFADVKVVQGATTLYQSNFTTGSAEWTTTDGTWATSGGYLRQTGGGTPAIAFVGDATWNNYTLTLRARKVSGAEGFLIAFGSPGNAANPWWNIGGWNNTRHVLDVPGVSTPDVGGNIQTGVWYDIKVELSGNNIRCYLNNALVHDTARLVDADERTARIQQILTSPGFRLLTPDEQSSMQELFNRSVYIGNAVRATFASLPSTATFASLSPEEQLPIIRRVGAHRLTWNTGWGFGGDPGTDQQIINSVDNAVVIYNSHGVFDKHLTANNSPGTPTADGGYDGQMRYGGQRSLRTALHEIAHTLGVGTYWRWPQLMTDGNWDGMYANLQLSEFDGSGAVLNGDAAHMWPYGLNYDQDYSVENARRHVLIVAALRRDMGIASTLWRVAATNIPNGTYRLIPRHATWAALDVLNADPSGGAATGISTYTGATSQKFLVDAQANGTYRIRTALSGNRALETPGGATANGTQVQLWDDNGLNPQRWYFVSMGDGWYKIAHRNDINKGMDVVGGNADGTPVKTWDYFDNQNQQWKLVPATPPAFITTIPNGAYRLTPRHATSSALNVQNAVPDNATPLNITTFTAADAQKWLVDLQSDGAYRIRTSLTGNRAIDLLNFSTANGAPLALYDDNGGLAQRWYFIPTDSGWFKIAPKLNMDAKCIDVAGGVGATADGTLIHNWDYLGGTNQQWNLTPMGGTATLSLSAATYSSSEGTSPATITVTRSGNTASAVTVDYVVTDGTATQPGDYTATSGTLTFALGETSKTISVPIINDTQDEFNETVMVTLSNPGSGAELGTKAKATLTIVDDDGLPTLDINPISLTEGNSGTKLGRFTVTLSPPSAQTVSVNYSTLNGTAITGSDFTTKTGTLTFAPGDTTKLFDVLITGDTTIENNENFRLLLSNPVNATLVKSYVFGTITNDDFPTLSIGDISVTEGSSSTTSATFTATLSAPSPQIISINYGTANLSAGSVSDYITTSGKLTFPANTTSKTITVPIIGDIVDELNESFVLNLTTPVNVLLPDTQAICVITDDDDAPGFTINDVTVTEGNAGSTDLNFTIKLSAPSSRSITVQYATTSHSALAGVDYTALSGKLTFSAGSTSRGVSIPVLGDIRDEIDETILVTLSAATNATITDAQGIGTIKDDDGTPSIKVLPASIIEGNAGTRTLSFPVKLSAVSGQTVTADFAISDLTATAGSDYAVTASGKVTFAPGQISRTIEVTVQGDVTIEADETLRVTLTNPVAATLHTATATADGTIISDDVPLVSVNNIVTTEANTATTATFTVKLSAPSPETVTVDFATYNGTATAGSDFTLKSGTLTFAPGETSKEVAVTIAGDTTNEADENFSLKLLSASRAKLGYTQGTVTILNDDSSSATLQNRSLKQF